MDIQVIRDNQFTIALVGRPNVGKSTLFNRLAGKKLAITDDQPGVTRDRKETTGTLGDLTFRLIDTAGLEEIFDKSLEARMRIQTEVAINEADLLLFMIDVKDGISANDHVFVNFVRTLNKPVVLVANKAESKHSDVGMIDAWDLNLGAPVPISAEHNEGMVDLYHAIQPHADEYYEKLANEEQPELDENAPMQMAIVGRPNAGKSTLINSLIGQERLLTGAEAGITRDSIAIDVVWEGKKIKLIDTAGMRRKSKIKRNMEKLSVSDSLRAIQYAQVVVLLVDAVLGLDKQDLQIASQIIEEGRGLIIALNKWDVVEDGAQRLQDIQDRLQTSLSQVRGVKLITLSAKTGRNLQKLIPSALMVYDLWNLRVSTSKLNRWIDYQQQSHPAPLVNGRRIKIKYMTQIKTRPPTFVLFVNKEDALPQSYLRYLMNSLRDNFDLEGVPLRMICKTKENPYDNKN